MPNKDEYMNAANTPPNKRTPRQQELVNEAHRVGMGDVKDADHNAHQRQKVYG